MPLLKELSSGLQYLFFPTSCEGCAQPLVRGEEVLCMHCELHMPLTGYHHIPLNETSLRLSGRFAFEHATSLAYFTGDGLLQHLIHGLKYRNKTQNGSYLGRQLGAALAAQGWRPDAIVPVPLHAKKQAKRGYNQSYHLAVGIAEVMRIPVVIQGIVRSRNTDSQTDKNREERLDNVRGAFTVTRPAAFEHKHLLLVDDVLTTGATLEACAQTLLRIPGVRISIATAGIAN